MEGIAEAQQPGGAPRGVKIVRDHRGHAPAHRLAADDQRPARPERRDRGHVLRLERLGPRRRLGARRRAAAGHVVELEAGDAQACFCQSLGDRGHRRRIHRCSGAVRQQDRMLGPVRSVDQEVRRH